MEYFGKEEFHGFYDKLSTSLKIRLDFLRLIIDECVYLSNIPGGIGRTTGNSQHNYEWLGEIRAVDGYIPDDVSFKEFYDAAIKAGFSGIGFYTGWASGRRGFHLDVREDRSSDDPALWASRWVTDSNGNGKNVYDVNFFELIHSEDV